MHADKHQMFYKLALLFLMEVVRHVQSTQYRKLVIFYEVYFLHADKHESFLKVDTNILGVFGQT